MVPHGRIPNTTTHIHPHTPIQTYPVLYPQWLHCFPPPPHQTHPTNLGTTDNIMEHQDNMKINVYETHQHAHSYADLGTSVIHC